MIGLATNRAFTPGFHPPPKGPMLAVLAPDSNVHDDWPDERRGVSLVRCGSLAEVRELARRGDVNRVFLDARLVDEPLIDAVRSIANASRNACVIALRTSIHPSNADEIAAVVVDRAAVRIVIRELREPLRVLLENLDRGEPDGVVRSIVAPLYATVPSALRQITLSAVLIGTQRREVSALAQCCFVSQRTLQRRLADAGMPHARKLLGWILALYSVWHLERSGWSPKRVAMETGFSSVDALAQFTRRQTGISLRGRANDCGFERSLQTFLSVVTGNEA